MPCALLESVYLINTLFDPLILLHAGLYAKLDFNVITHVHVGFQLPSHICHSYVCQYVHIYSSVVVDNFLGDFTAAINQVLALSKLIWNVFI